MAAAMIAVAITAKATATSGDFAKPTKHPILV
jgi:hypothetical protein